MPILLVSFYNTSCCGAFFNGSKKPSWSLLLPSLDHASWAQVFLQRASVARHQGNLKVYQVRTYMILLRLGLFPILLSCLFAPPLFAFVLGERWFEAGSLRAFWDHG